MAINAALTRRFQRNLLRKIAADDPAMSSFVNRLLHPDPLLYPSVPPLPPVSAVGDAVRKQQEFEDAQQQLYTLNGGPWNETGKGAVRDRYINAAKNFPDEIQNPDEAIAAREHALKVARIKEVLKNYSPWVGGGLGLGALVGGSIGYGASKNKTSGTLLGSLIGAGAGGLAGGVGKYLYDKSQKK